MTTGLTYSQYVTQIATMAVVPEADPEFIKIIPQMITYAENRIYRDLDLLNTVVTNTGFNLTANNPRLNITQGTFVTIQNINVLTPAGQTNPNATTCTRVSLLPVSKEYIQTVWNSNSGNGVPSVFAVYGGDTYASGGNTSQSFLFGPWPNANYTLEIVGTVRPDSLSSSNPQTFVSLYMPDIFIMASMIYISAYQRNFGKIADDPAMAQTYEGQYQALLNGARVEEFRKKFQASAWTSETPAVIATPTR